MISLRYKRKETDDIESIEQLTKTEYQVLMGSILGDAHIAKGGSYSESHCEAQKEYSLWKLNVLSRFNPVHSERFATTRGKQYKQSVVTTKQYSVLKILRKEFYQTSKKGHLPINILKDMDELGLMVWYFDDGGKNENDSFQIAAEEFTGNDNAELFIDLLNKKLGLDLYITNHGTIYINTESQKVLLPIWEKLFEDYDLPECMRYKIVRNQEYADYDEWTDEEIGILKDNYSKFSFKELKSKFFPTFSLSRIFEKGNTLRLKSFKSCRLDADEKFITENYLKDRGFFRKALLTRKDRRRIFEKMRRMGLLKERLEIVGKQPYNTWTDAEEQILKDNYLLRWNKLMILLPNKKRDCIIQKSKRNGLYAMRIKELNGGTNND